MNLDRAQVDWTLGRFPYEELPELAAQMMMQGFESPAILELASFHRPGPHEVPGDLVDRAFQDCGRDPLSREEAGRRSVEQMLRSESPAAEVLSAVWQLTAGGYELAYGNDPLAELSRLALDWDDAADDPLMQAALEDQLPAVGRRFLDYLGKSR